ncbi:hypothetical protein BUALT_Bualt02G0089700 [Buddleja alternifolia]|uniref:Integrase catalytic domain-containing protein n=1 Tax=Buddleja alternifolia TaxID=168488 RepID=A0AAV6Y5E7_9LAMI|nr:hypothetical protein BUALT_Bualt02G0089700 [Buddleja alternifolia]
MFTSYISGSFGRVKMANHGVTDVIDDDGYANNFGEGKWKLTKGSLITVKHCCDHGIRLEKSVPKTPQHNDVAEKMNRTICERIKCMLPHSKLPKSFLGEAMRTVVDLINISSSAPLDGDIPDRVWSGKDISYKHLRVFGCRAFVHIPRDERS